MSHAPFASAARVIPALAVALLAAGCATPSPRPGGAYLSEGQVVDLMRHPRRWDGRTVTIRAYPYDNGFVTSYVLCFEACTPDVAERSPFIVITRENKYRGYRGERAVVLTAHYSSACFYRVDAICHERRFGQFTEIAAP